MTGPRKERGWDIMKNLYYLMGFQILVGLWLMISPFILGFREFTGIVANNLIFGAIVLLLGIGALYYQRTAPGIEGMAKKVA